MTKVVNIKADPKPADGQAKKIAELRELFDVTYKPQFRPGDIVRYRASVVPYLSYSKDERPGDWLGIVVEVREAVGDWAGYRRIDPENDLMVAVIAFDKELQRNIAKHIVGSCREFELVERGPEPAPAAAVTLDANLEAVAGSAARAREHRPS